MAAFVSVTLLLVLACTCSAAATNQSINVWQPSPGGGEVVPPAGGGGSEAVPPAEDEEDLGQENARQEITLRINSVRGDYYNAMPLENNDTLNSIAGECADNFEYRYATFDPAAVTGSQDQDTYNFMEGVYRCKNAEEKGYLEYYCLAPTASSTSPESAANYCLQQWIDTQRGKYEENNKQEYSKDTRHFTQIVWKDTKRFGCAVTEKIKLGLAVNQRALICLFDPPGNQIIAFSNSLAFKNNVEPLKN